MRIGVLSDIHANLFALQAALRRLKAEGVDSWVCAGDLVGYGPHPNECVETIAELDPVAVTGNHELLVLGAIPAQRAGRLARTSLTWTRDAIRDDVRSYLAALPRVAHAPGVVVAHGSLDDPEEYVRSGSQAAGQLSTLSSGHEHARLLVLGHTHRQWLFEEAAGTVVPAERASGRAFPLAASSRFLINPGAVGQSRERESVPRARFALVDLDQDEVRFFAEPYDVKGCRAALRANGLSRDSIHVRRGSGATLARRARTLLGMVRERQLSPVATRS